MARSFKLIVKDREKTHFDGEAVSISSENSMGTFDILPDHANFVSLIDQKLTVRDVSGAVTEIKIGKGVIRTADNKTEVFMGIKAT